MTEVHVEQACLDDGAALIVKEFGQRVRVAFDPRQISEMAALRQVYLRVPRLAGAMRIVHRADV